MPSTSTPMNRLDFPRPRDKAVKDYCAWQQSQVEDPEQKDPYQKAYEVIMKNCMSLELIYRDPNPDFLIHAGVPTGAALHIVGDIED
jgi:intergrase/recombinase